MNGVLGHDFALVWLCWNGDNLVAGHTPDTSLSYTTHNKIAELFRNEMYGALGHASTLGRLCWAGDNLVAGHTPDTALSYITQ